MIKPSRIFGKPLAKPPKPAKVFGTPTTAAGGITRGGGPVAAGGQGQVVVPGSESAPKDITAPDESWKDSLYNQGQSNIQTGLNNLGGYLLNQGQGLGAEYGVDTIGADPTKYDPAHPASFNVDWANVDVTNPFSKAALLKRTHLANERGNTNSMAARGQLYSGALQNAQDNENFNYLGGQNALTSDFGSKWAGLYGQWLTGQQSADQQRLDNTSAAYGRHQTDPAAPPPINPALVEWFKNNSLVGNKWVPNDQAKPAATPAAAKPVDPKQWLRTHKLVGGKWVPR